MSLKIDELDRRCPRLGGPVAFPYCLTNESGDLPCHKIIDCWWEMFDVTSYVKELLPADKFDELISARSKPPEKISSLLDLIEKAKSRQKASND